MESKSLKQKGFSDYLSIPESSLSQILNGKRYPSTEVLIAITKAYPEINCDWLLKGEGSMYRNQTKEESPSYQTKSIHDLEVLFDRVDTLEQQVSELKKQA